MISGDASKSSSVTSSTEELETKDKEGIALLRVIFPDTPTETLMCMHLNRVHSGTSQHVSSQSGVVQDSAARKKNHDTLGHSISTPLPDDFLRIPLHQALKVRNWITGVVEWKVVKDLEDSVIHSHLLSDPDFAYQVESCQLIGSTVVTKNKEHGFGIQLGEWDKHIYINALKCPNGSSIETIEAYSSALESVATWDSFGPAFINGLKPGDRILGVNGIPFLKSGIYSSYTNYSRKKSNEMVNFAVECIQNSSSHLVVHVIRHTIVSHPQLELAISSRDSVSRSDESTLSERSDHLRLKSNDRSNRNIRTTARLRTEYIHPIAKLLRLKGLSKSAKDETNLSKELVVYNSRARLWETNSYLHNEYFGCSYYRVRKDLEKVRQALCIHIVNSFLEKDSLVYTIWVQDVESNATWYAPLRYSHEFHDLRAAILSFDKSIGAIPFPRLHRWIGHESHMPHHIQENQRSELGYFLQELCNRIYNSEDMEYISETAFYVQSFLGCDDIDFSKSQLEKKFDQTCMSNPFGAADALLKFQQAIRLYTFRMFLLSSLQTLVRRFISDVKARVSIMESKKSITPKGLREKEKILSEISMVRTVLSSLVKLVISGCQNDFDVIIQSNEYQTLLSDRYHDDLEKVIEFSVREQVETIIYVPLRSSLSSLILHGWRHDDYVIEQKMTFLRQQGQEYFNIKPEDQSPSNWRSVVGIMKGVGKSTLPCQKLHCIVQAAKNIGYLRAEEHKGSDCKSLGADDFLPIFIYCFIQSEIEHPCALCALLRHFAESSQLIGEIGYYLSSFEAALMYIIELDLSIVSGRHL